MTRKIFIPILTAVALAVMTSCGGDSPKSRISHSIREISHSMREYTGQTLQPGESFEFIGLSNQRDTIYMGVTRPCAGVIYKINASLVILLRGMRNQRKIMRMRKNQK